MRAMVLGDRAGLDDETAEAFRIAGTYHVLALSGRAGRAAGRAPGRGRCARAGRARAAAAVWSRGARLLRAARGRRRAGRPRDGDGGRRSWPAARSTSTPTSRTCSAWPALLLLVHRPSAVGDVGFQLSFAATLGLILLTRPLARAPALPLRLHVALARLAAPRRPRSVPLLAVHFHRVAPAAPLLNLVAVPLSGGVLLAGAAVRRGARWRPARRRRSGDVAWSLAHALLALGDRCAPVPALDHRVPAPAGLAPWPCTRRAHPAVRGRPRPRAPGPPGAGACGLVVGARRRAADGRLHVDVLDVGQGDAIVVRSPRGRAWWWTPAALRRRLRRGGGGGRARISGRSACGALEACSSRIPIPTTRAASRSCSRVRGRRGLGRAGAAAGPGLRRLDAALREARRRARGRCAAACGRSGTAWRSRCWGHAAGPPPWKTRNDDSVVLSVRYGARDGPAGRRRRGAGRGASCRRGGARAEGPAPRQPVQQQPRLLAAAWARAWRSCRAGYRNRFGHPHPDVVARYRRGASARAADRP